MELSSIIQLGLLGATILALLIFLYVKKEPHTDRLSLSRYRTNLIKALLFSTVLAMLLSLNWGSNLFYILSGYSIGMVLIGHTGIYLVQRIGARKQLSFFYQQALEFFAALLGIGLGSVISNAVMFFLWEDFVEPFWQSPPFFSARPYIIAGTVLTGLLVASIRAFYNFKLFDEAQARAQQELDAMRLQEQATSAQLEMLQTRINPHFLYNALKSIASLVHEDPDKAEEMTMALSRLFRASLNANNSHCTTVQQEIALVQTYLDVEKLRFGHRLSTSMSVDPKALDEKIPQFLLQPLVENAVKQGMASQDGDGFVGIEICKKEDTLHIFIKDSGPDFPMHMPEGHSWKSVSDSLELLYPGRHELFLVNSPEKHVHLSLKDDDHHRTLN